MILQELAKENTTRGWQMMQLTAGRALAMGVLCAVFLSQGASARAVPVPQPRPESTPIYRSYQKEIECLSRAIYFEARGEPHVGQKAVARVILNRVESNFYPDTVCDVVYQNDHLKNACQFSFACDSLPDRIREPRAFETAELIARAIFDCDERRCDVHQPLRRSTHYHADFVLPGWASKLERTGQVGRHIFYYTASM
ncbi:cell wall hydrolase [Nitratireductor thuwali]